VIIDKYAHIIQGACEALGCLKSAEALPVLVRQLSKEDRWVRHKAAQALKRIGGEAKPTIPDILKAVVDAAEPLQPVEWADPVQLTQGQFQGGHRSESRTGEIMKEIASYGRAAREALPELKEVIVSLNDQVKDREFPEGELNDRSTGAVEAAIKAIEAAKDHPELRTIVAVQAK